MNIFKTIFGNKSNPAGGRIYAPVGGTVVPLDRIPDPAFAGGALGEGCGIKPNGDTIYSPVDGVIESVADSLHAIGILTDDGGEILIHVGIDTVEMRGAGFHAAIKRKDRVCRGQKLLTFDKKKIKQAGLSDIVCLTLANSGEFASVRFCNLSIVSVGDEIASFSQS